MKTRLLSLALLFCIFTTRSALAQTISNVYAPIIETAPRVYAFAETPEGDYLIGGSVDYYNGTQSGSLIKVDKAGNRIETFHAALNKTVTDIEIQSDGKIIVCATTDYLSEQPSVYRLNADGSIDQSFTQYPGWNAHDIEIQSDGKIIVAGGFIDYGGKGYNFLARLKPDGTIDETFQVNHPINITLENVELTSQDEIICIAYNTNLKKLDKDGNPDPNFLHTPTFEFGNYSSFVVTPDDEILVAANVTISLSPYTTEGKVLRVNSDGSIDNAFVSPAFNSAIYKIFQKSDGSVIVYGSFTKCGDIDTNFAELNEDGTFNQIVGATNVNAVIIFEEDSEQNVLMFGECSYLNNDGFRSIGKFSKDNVLDKEFVLPIARGNNYSFPLEAQSDGKLILARNQIFEKTNGVYDWLVRLNHDGTNDTTFSSTADGSWEIYDIEILANKKILLGGIWMGNGSEELIRLNEDGSRDLTFNDIEVELTNGYGYISKVKVVNNLIYVSGSFNKINGVAVSNFAILNGDGEVVGPDVNVLYNSFWVRHMLVQGDGKVVLSGDFTFPDDDKYYTVIRLNSDGSIDQSFHPVENNAVYINDIALDAGNHIWLVGNFQAINGVSVPGIAKLNKDGSVDTSVNFENKFGGTGYNNPVLITILSNGNIALGGYFEIYDNVESPYFVLIDNTGKIAGKPSTIELGSELRGVSFNNNTLFYTGRVVLENGHVGGIAKILFDLEGSITDLSAQMISDSQIDLTWSANLKGAEFFTLDISTDSIHYTTVDTLSIDAESYSLTGLNEITKYFARLTAANEISKSLPVTVSDTTDIKPIAALPVTDLEVRSFRANWQDIPNTEVYTLQVATDSEFTALLSGYENLELTEVTKLITDLEPNTYYYRVKRTRNGFSSEFSSAVEVNTLSVVGTERDFSDEVKVYPNPANHSLHVKGLVGTNPSFEIVTVDGKSFEAPFTVLSGSYIINISHLRQGLYLLKASSARESVSIRFSKASEQ